MGLAASPTVLYNRRPVYPVVIIPYLIPMLENAGANVFTPRERDTQKQEVIVDNDGNLDRDSGQGLSTLK